MLTALRSALWGSPTIILVSVFSVYFTFVLLKNKIVAPTRIFGDLYRSIRFHGAKKGETTPFSAAATALGGTVGVGSILGVGHALSVGGAGSIFWMWVCSFFGMGLKYAEVRIALNGEKKGTHHRLAEKGFGISARIFCVFCILSSFCTGTVIQTGSVALLADRVGADARVAGIFCAAVAAVAFFGGKKRITGINTVLIPFCCICYLSLCVCVLWLGKSGLSEAFCRIFEGAFSKKAFFGGVGGATFAQALKEGFARSVFSTEAGMGSSSLAHADAEGSTPHLQGEWGMAEIFFDTFLVSTLTALMLLTFESGDIAAVLTESLGKIGLWLLLMLTGVFGLGAMLSWCVYGESCVCFLGGGTKTLFVYRLALVCAAFSGSCIPNGILWELADIFNAAMLYPNLFLMFVCRKEILIPTGRTKCYVAKKRAVGAFERAENRKKRA